MARDVGEKKGDGDDVQLISPKSDAGPALHCGCRLLASIRIRSPQSKYSTAELGLFFAAAGFWRAPRPQGTGAASAQGTTNLGGHVGTAGGGKSHPVAVDSQSCHAGSILGHLKAPSSALSAKQFALARRRFGTQATEQT